MVVEFIKREDFLPLFAVFEEDLLGFLFSSLCARLLQIGLSKLFKIEEAVIENKN